MRPEIAAYMVQATTELMKERGFTPETIAEAIKQSHEDRFLDGEITDWLKVDRYADEMDRAYDRMVERRMGCM